MKKFYFECSICPILRDNIVRYITNTKKIFTPDFIKQNDKAPHRPTLAHISNSYAVCRRLPTHHQYSKSQPLSVGIFFACSPVKTAMTSRASRPGPRRNLGLGDLTTIELLNNPVLPHI